MKKRFIIIKLYFLVAIFSCEDKPAYEKEGWTDSQYQPDKIELSKATLKGNPIILKKVELLEIEGNPIQVRDSCTKIPIRHNQGIVTYDCWIYDTMWHKVYQIVNETSFLSHFNFEESNLEIKTPQITLSKNTRFKEIKKKFPNSYAHRNIGANYYRNEGYDWVYLIDDLPSENKLYPSQIELRFKDGKLKHMEYQWQPNYTKEQLETYHQQMKEYEQKNE